MTTKILIKAFIFFLKLFIKKYLIPYIGRKKNIQPNLKVLNIFIYIFFKLVETLLLHLS